MNPTASRARPCFRRSGRPETAGGRVRIRHCDSSNEPLPDEHREEGRRFAGIAARHPGQTTRRDRGQSPRGCFPSPPIQGGRLDSRLLWDRLICRSIRRGQLASALFPALVAAGQGRVAISAFEAACRAAVRLFAFAGFLGVPLEISPAVDAGCRGKGAAKPLCHGPRGGRLRLSSIWLAQSPVRCAGGSRLRCLPCTAGE